MKTKSEKRLKLEKLIVVYLENMPPDSKFTSADILGHVCVEADLEMVRKILRGHYQIGNVGKYDRNTWITNSEISPLKEGKRTIRKTDGARGIIREFIEGLSGTFSSMDLLALDKVDVSIHTIRKILIEFEGDGFIERSMSNHSPWQKRIKLNAIRSRHTEGLPPVRLESDLKMMMR